MVTYLLQLFRVPTLRRLFAVLKHIETIVFTLQRLAVCAIVVVVVSFQLYVC